MYLLGHPTPQVSECRPLYSKKDKKTMATRTIDNRRSPPKFRKKKQGFKRCEKKPKINQNHLHVWHHFACCGTNNFVPTEWLNILWPYISNIFQLVARLCVWTVGWASDIPNLWVRRFSSEVPYQACFELRENRITTTQALTSCENQYESLTKAADVLKESRLECCCCYTPLSLDGNNSNYLQSYY